MNADERVQNLINRAAAETGQTPEQVRAAMHEFRDRAEATSPGVTKAIGAAARIVAAIKADDPEAAPDIEGAASLIDQALETPCPAPVLLVLVRISTAAHEGLAFLDALIAEGIAEHMEATSG